MPAGRYIPGTPIAVDLWSRRGVEQNVLYFLSHMHTDHTSGLSSSWDKLIYCSEITKSLAITRLKIKPSLLVVLPIGETTIINIDERGIEQLAVTVFDANHCPGAVMFLFEGYFGRILYTADFRFTESMLNIPALKSNISRLYLDNTYCDPLFEFPTKSQATLVIFNILHQHPGYDVVFGLDTLGKEDLLYKVGLVLGRQVAVDQLRFQTVQLLGNTISEVFTMDDKASFVRVVKRQLVNDYWVGLWNRTRPTIVILPTSRYVGNPDRPYTRGSNIFVVPYSDHSCFSELSKFVEAIKPQQLYPIVTKPCQVKSKSIATSPLDLNAIFAEHLSKQPVASVQIPKSVQEFMQKMSNVQQPQNGQKRRMSSYFGKKGKKPSGIVFSQEKDICYENGGNEPSSSCSVRDVTDQISKKQNGNCVETDDFIQDSEDTETEDTHIHISKKQNNNSTAEVMWLNSTKHPTATTTDPTSDNSERQNKQQITTSNVAHKNSQQQHNSHITTNVSNHSSKELHINKNTKTGSNSCQNCEKPDENHQREAEPTVETSNKISKRQNERDNTTSDISHQNSIQPKCYTATREDRQMQNENIERNITNQSSKNQNGHTVITVDASCQNSKKQNVNYFTTADISAESSQNDGQSQKQVGHYFKKQSGGHTNVAVSFHDFQKQNECQETESSDNTQDAMLSEEDGSIVFDKAPCSPAAISEERAQHERRLAVGQPSLLVDSTPVNIPEKHQVVCTTKETELQDESTDDEEWGESLNHTAVQSIQQKSKLYNIEQMLAGAYRRLIRRNRQNKKGKASNSSDKEETLTLTKRKGQTKNDCNEQDQKIIQRFMDKLYGRIGEISHKTPRESDKEGESSVNSDTNAKTTTQLETDFDTFDEELLANAVDKQERRHLQQQPSTNESDMKEESCAEEDLPSTTTETKSEYTPSNCTDEVILERPDALCMCVQFPMLPTTQSDESEEETSEDSEALESKVVAMEMCGQLETDPVTHDNNPNSRKNQEKDIIMEESDSKDLIIISDSEDELLAEATIAGEQASFMNAYDSTEEDMFQPDF